MTTELWRGGITTKITLNGYLKDITNNETIKINTNAIKDNEKITCYQDDEKYVIEIISPTNIILKRNTKELESIIYFDLGKVLKSNYTIKENNLSLGIDIRTNNIEINEKYIKISYTVIDSSNDYEYYIEMSEWYEYKKYNRAYYKM